MVGSYAWLSVCLRWLTEHVVLLCSLSSLQVHLKSYRLQVGSCVSYYNVKLLHFMTSWAPTNSHLVYHILLNFVIYDSIGLLQIKS